MAVKVVGGVHPGNAGGEGGLPTVTGGAVAYFDARGGRLLAVMDGGEAITGVRTAGGATAISAMVAGAPTSTIGGVVGGTGGVEARYHLMLLTAVFKPRRVLVAGRDPR